MGRPAAALLLCWLVACAAETSPAPRDGGVDTAPDGSPEAAVDGAVEGGVDAAMDSSVTVDSGLDAAMDSGGAMDSGLDSSADSGMDAGAPCAVGGVPGVCVDVALCTGDRSPTPGLCPGPAEIQCCAPTGSATCDESAMPTPNAGLAEAPGSGGCPAGMLAVGGAFCVDRYEASLEEIAADGSVRSWSPYFNPAGHRVRARSIGGAVPQAYIDANSAAAACAEAGKRLCTDTEWLRACRGSMGTTYPYGDTRMDGVCNDARATHPAVEYFGTSASWIWSMLGNPCIDQLPDSLSPTGTHAGCVTEDGAFDMMGNLHEWTSDPAGTFRGGYYVDTVRNGEGCLYRTTAHDRSHWDYSTGFRCCADLPAG